MDRKDLDDFMRRSVASLGSLSDRVSDLEKIESQSDLYSDWSAALANHLLIPGLRGFWPMSSIDSNGDLIDLSGQGRLLTNTGQALGLRDGLIPSLYFDGSNDYLTRTSEAGLQITGTESYIDTSFRGLSLGGWFKLPTAAAASLKGLICKDNAPTNRSYGLRMETTGKVSGIVSLDGSTVAASVTSSEIAQDDVWFFSALTFDPSASLNIFFNDVISTNTTSIPASIFSSNAAFNIMAFANGAAIRRAEGYPSLCWLSCQFLDDDFIQALYYSTKGLFGL